MGDKPLSEVRKDPGYCILMPGGRIYFDSDGRYRWTRVGATLRTMFPVHPAFQGVPTRHLEERLIPRFGADELFLHHGEDV